ncbi:hypothetical protein M9Y10_001415 [Tritrichomonas musculus]|uniref:Leucine-rich repeat domain-containing protein n=1 Tax=Tritrichomonas musculus TaxID=1915356 RepID=A0ABR2L6Y0_9EUKA
MKRITISSSVTKICKLSFDDISPSIQLSFRRIFQSIHRFSPIAKLLSFLIEQRKFLKVSSLIAANLIKVVIPNSVASIESSLFAGCSSLPEVAIPDSVIVRH